MLPVGVLGALLITQLPFNFPALLGLIGLIGMLLKNAIVMIGEIDRRTAAGTLARSTIVASCVSRFRPIMLAAMTTVAGMATSAIGCVFPVYGRHYHGWIGNNLVTVTVIPTGGLHLAAWQAGTFAISATKASQLIGCVRNYRYGYPTAI